MPNFEQEAPESEEGCEHGHIGACTQCFRDQELAAKDARIAELEAHVAEVTAIDLEAHRRAVETLALNERTRWNHERLAAEAWRNAEYPQLVAELERLRARVAELEAELGPTAEQAEDLRTQNQSLAAQVMYLNKLVARLETISDPLALYRGSA